MPVPPRTFVGFGFGAIQGGLFLYEAHRSGNFGRLVVAEVVPEVVAAIRRSGGCYRVNVATRTGIEVHEVSKVEIYNPLVPGDAAKLVTALAEASEICTALPSVDFFTRGEPSIADLLADAVRRKTADTSLPACIVYTAENHNHAAEILEQAVSQRWNGPLPPQAQFLNTVIGKMSQVVTDPQEMAERSLAPIAPGIDRAFLVEEFNRILVSKTTIPGFTPGIRVFIEKDDLLPFEEAKLYGHNAIHALLGFIGMLKGYTKMTELKDDTLLMNVARKAFIQESGAALVPKYASLGDELFTEAGYRLYAQDLLERMTNPYLADTVARAGRDVVRKLGATDRIFGTMALALEQGIEPKNMAMGAMAGVALLLANAPEYGLPQDLRSLNWRRLNAPGLTPLLTWLWQSPASPPLQKLIDCTCAAREPLAGLLAK